MLLSPSPSPAPLLDISGLTVVFDTDRGRVTAVRDLDLWVGDGETLAVVGESGSGKSVTSLAITRLIDYTSGRIAGGSIRWRGRDGVVRDLAAETPEGMRRLRGSDIAMVFQHPMTSLNPVLRIGEQIAESVMLHQGLDRTAAWAEARRLLEQVRIPAAVQRLRQYPFQLSGGMRQRVMIAVALSCRPRLLIADEPTTALDVTVQAQVLRLMRSLQRDLDMAMIFITHDMGVVAEVADRVAVMRRGEKVEEGDAVAIFEAPRHPYTQRLLAAVPRLGSLAAHPLPLAFPSPEEDAPTPQDTVAAGAAPVLEVRDLTTRFDVRGGLLGRAVGRIHAVEKVSLSLRAGETLAVVGESGCGKSTTGLSILRLEQPVGGHILFEGRDVTQLTPASEAALRRGVQYVFQDPFASLDPRLTIGVSVAEPILTHGLASGIAVEARVRELLHQVGLPAAYVYRYPHELSGGECQRVCIARALASEPRVIIADEAVAALDVSIRAQVVNLLMDLQARRGLAYLFISHDMAVVERVAHRVAVMYLGQVVEIGPRQAVLSNPRHPYTQRLLAAVPAADPRRRGRETGIDDSEVPSPMRPLDDPPETAPLVAVGEDHFVARHRVGGMY
ncbi:glutathione ABC transporter ATP binding subunit GsiA [Rhodovastum atsumiense]|uniref:ABC transporter ATP-binding protein n=1 Tax=Rhodovastum atsumiense TaxID=504468 RepID=A0A5M6ISQ2_9PROT|nr:ABC transporter ATP-binding protein [Rhodovastum atsumiense]KAA5611282.1 ABC transporter ATP-binding protein [Rhodovastum atsumiense]CAH2601746.1 glutathione ABC transporter ATP binding subunit GsiA [Rhodovastum atsumiense]